MAIKYVTAGMLLCSLVILGMVFAQERKRAPILTTDDVPISGDRATVRPGDSGRPGAPSGSQYSGPVPNVISWEHDLQSALDKAADGNRVVIVDVYTDWCGWCKRMDRDIYSNAQVAALGREAVFLKLNAEDEGEGQRFARSHGIHGFPTTIIMDARGRALQSEAGYISPPGAFVEWVHQARDQERN
jgi:thiol-disulfide isomerase/thioredoxin